MLESIQSFFTRIHESRYSSLVYALSLMLVAAAILGVVSLLPPKKKPLPDKHAYTRAECTQMESELLGLRHELDSLNSENDEPFNEAQARVAGKLLTVYDGWLGECAGGVPTDAYYEKVRVRHETFMATGLAEKVRTNEKEGLDALRRHDYETARRRLSGALDAQSRINETFPSADQADVVKRVTLERALNQALYEPVMAAYLALKEQAESAFDQSNYDQARLLYARLLREIEKTQVEIPQSYFSFDEPTLTTKRRLEESAARIRARDMDSALAEAKKAVDARDWKTAETFYSQAKAVQKEIASDYPDSTIASPQVASDLEKSRQNDLSQEYGEILEGLTNDIAESLRATDDGRLQKQMTKTATILAELEAKYPDSAVLKDGIVERMKYLMKLRYGLVEIRRTMVASLKPVPGNPDWSLLECEVWQLLYTRLMESNPSLRKDDFLPVEGCNLEEAREFARRLSWIMAADVRLPDVDTYRRLIKVSDTNFIRKYAWSSLTSPKKEPMKVSTSRRDDYGYFDLVGNVAEWAEFPHPSASAAYIIGGSVRDAPARLAELPAEEHKASERVRNAGFRVMIHYGK